MFNFNFQYPFGFFSVFLPALFNLGILVYIFLFLPKIRVTNIFALVTVACTLWQLNDCVQRVSVTESAADAWDSIFSAAWLFIGPLCLHFSLLYTRAKIQHSRLYTYLIYAPGFIFLTLYQGHFYDHPFKKMAIWGWTNFHNDSIIDIIQIYWVSLSVVGALILLFVHTFKIQNDKLLKRQSFFITIGIAIPTVAGTVTQVIMPTVFHHDPIPVTSTFMTFLSVATVIALKKYNLFTVSDLISNRALIDSIPIIVFSVSTDKRITYINRFGKQKLGLSRKDHITLLKMDNLFYHATEEEIQGFDEMWRRVTEERKIENRESVLMTPVGKINIILSSNPIVNNNKVQGILFTARDITELKRTNQLLEEAQHISHIGSWDWDTETTTVRWSNEMYRIYGYKPGELSPLEIFLKHVPATEQEKIKKVMDTARNDYGPVSYYHSIVRKDGTVVEVHAQGKVTLNERNEVIRINGTTQDVTELRHKEEMLRRQNEELQKINSELDKFVYSVSHDLRAPLTSMLGIIEISEEETAEPSLREQLLLLRKSIYKLDKFILNILDYSRNARQDINKEEIDFRQMVADIVKGMDVAGNGAPKVDIRIGVDGNHRLYSDKNRISIVLNNLISNGIRYCDTRSNQPFVEVNLHFRGKEACIVVKDNGIGIDKGMHDRIFEMFYRGSEKSTGSGLGLYIAKEAVNRLNGRITVQSERDKGSIFSVYLPNN